MRRNDLDSTTNNLCLCGCGLPSNGRFILRHNLRVRNQSGPNNHQWKGGKPKKDIHGYWLAYSPNHPNKRKDSKVFEHRLIYEQYLSIIFDEELFLKKEEEIHHINGQPDDNRLINLEYKRDRKEHKQEHLVDMSDRICKACKTTISSIRSDGGTEKWHGNAADGWLCVSCHKKEYWIRNKERIQQYRKNNEERFRESNRERCREYYKQNRETLLEREIKRYWDKKNKK